MPRQRRGTEFGNCGKFFALGDVAWVNRPDDRGIMKTKGPKDGLRVRNKMGSNSLAALLGVGARLSPRPGAATTPISHGLRHGHDEPAVRLRCLAETSPEFVEIRGVFSAAPELHVVGLSFEKIRQ